MQKCLCVKQCGCKSPRSTIHTEQYIKRRFFQLKPSKNLFYNFFFFKSYSLYLL